VQKLYISFWIFIHFDFLIIIDNITLSKGKATVNLKEGEDDMKLKKKKGAVVVEDNATVDINKLNVADVKLTNYKNDPVVKNISGSIAVNGVEASFLGGTVNATPTKITLKSGTVVTEDILF
jgi:hypothetical protein